MARRETALGILGVLGLALGIITAIIRPYGDFGSWFVAGALFLITITSIGLIPRVGAQERRVAGMSM